MQEQFFNQSLLHRVFFRKENLKFFEVAFPAVLCNGTFG